MQGNFIGVGVGPGDPELMTLKAARCINEADVIAYICNEQGESTSRHIWQSYVNELAQGETKEQLELPIAVNMFIGREAANSAYDLAAEKIQTLVTVGKKVVFICEGDPLFFGSFGYLLERLESRISCQVVPGISSVNAASAAIKKPLTLLRESFAVASGRHDEAALTEVLKTHDSVVIMKAGKERQTILNALAKAGRSHEAHYLENISRENEFIVDDITQLDPKRGPYFSLFVVIPSQRDRS